MEELGQFERTITYEEFKTLPDWQRMEIAAKNRVINTDTYNRTMNFLRGPEGWREQETYTLQMRRSPFNYLVVSGVEDAVAELTSQPITQEELDFAEAFYADKGIDMFNKEMWQAVVDEYDGKLPFEIHAMPDGSVALPGEPIISVTGPGELVAHFEHVFHRPFYSTLVATKAHEIYKAIGDASRFIEVGKRGVPQEITHLAAVKAMQVGGSLNLTSNDAGAAVFEDVMPVGTIGHRYVQRFPSVEAAFRHAIENLDSVSLLVDLVDSYDGLNLSLELKDEYRDTGKKIYVRLDSGDVKEQVKYYLKECEARGFTDPVLDKATVEGLDDLLDITDIEQDLRDDQRARAAHGAGGLIVANDTRRSDASTGFKLSEYEDTDGAMVPSMKFSNSPGKHSIPGRPTVAYIDGVRTIAQLDEVTEDENLMQLMYQNGELQPQSTIKEAQQRRAAQYLQALPLIERGEKAVFSKSTAVKIGEVMARYGLEE
ncbi:DUF5598 domain-containing protein [Candidatus Saccharibacteria bacterium]|nr:DUF5598 domain-containing protein [Candidatus Saccharibacteria bacterium]